MTVKKYAKVIAGYGGEKYALFDKNGNRVGESSMINGERHRKELRRSGYVIKRGYVRR